MRRVHYSVYQCREQTTLSTWGVNILPISKRDTDVDRYTILKRVFVLRLQTYIRLTFITNGILKKHDI